jgi:hypothetical protein
VIFIPGEVPSSKNSKVKAARGVFMSKATRQYLQAQGIKSYSARNGVEGYKRRPNLFDTPALRHEFAGREYPIVLGMHFVRATKRRWDFCNMSQIICDLLVAHKIIVDDDIEHLIPVALRFNDKLYSVDKERPGVWLQTFRAGVLPSVRVHKRDKCK